MSSDTPAVSSACVMPGASFTMKVIMTQITSIATAAKRPRSTFFIDP